MNIRESLDIYLELVETPRSRAHITYETSDILFLLVVRMLYNCTGLDIIIEFAKERIDFLEKYTEIETVPCLSILSNI